MFEKVGIFGLIDVDLECTGAGTLKISTDLPGNALAVRETKNIPTTTRRVLRFRLSGHTKGHLYKLNITPTSGAMRLYGARIWARTLPDGEWAWRAVPIIETPVEWTPVKLPIPETGEWQPAKLPVPQVGEWTPEKLPVPETTEWSPSKLPIPPTSDWFGQGLPIKPTPQNPEWVEIQVDS